MRAADWPAGRELFDEDDGKRVLATEVWEGEGILVRRTTP